MIATKGIRAKNAAMEAMTQTTKVVVIEHEVDYDSRTQEVNGLGGYNAVFGTRGSNQRCMQEGSDSRGQGSKMKRIKRIVENINDV
jgi:hypothetical protein